MTTLTLLGDDGEPINFPLFKKEGETNNNFLHRIFGYAEVWCPMAKESDIPASGNVRNVWNNYCTIRLLTEEELADDIYYTSGDDTRRSHELDGMFCRSWLTLLYLESRTRSKNACSRSSGPSGRSESEKEPSAS
jgi:hypothetical protein